MKRYALVVLAIAAVLAAGLLARPPGSGARRDDPPVVLVIVDCAATPAATATADPCPWGVSGSGTPVPSGSPLVVSVPGGGGDVTITCASPVASPAAATTPESCLEVPFQSVTVYQVGTADAGE